MEVAMNEVSRRNLIHTTTIAAAAATLPTVASASPAGGQPGHGNESGLTTR